MANGRILKLLLEQLLPVLKEQFGPILKELLLELVKSFFESLTDDEKQQVVEKLTAKSE